MGPPSSLIQATDLDRVLQIYQFWSHKLYPKTRFKETVDRVEKLCHSKRMQVCAALIYFISSFIFVSLSHSLSDV